VTATTSATSSTKIGKGGKAGKRGIPKSTSFGSASSLSSLASGGTASSLGGKRARRSRVGGVDHVGGAERRPSSGSSVDEFIRDPHASGNGADDLDDGPGWDEDEISLWSAPKSYTHEYAKDAGMKRIDLKNRIRAGRSNVKDDVAVQDSMSSHKRDLDVRLHTDSTDKPPVVDGDDVAPYDWATRRKRMHAQRNKLQRRNWDEFLKVAHDASEFDRNRLVPNTSAEELNSCSKFYNHQDLNVNPPAEYVNESNLHQMKFSPKIPPSTPTTALCKNERSSTKKTNDTSIDSSKGSQGAVIVDDGKQHWMPDNLCKHCYSCEAPFTLVRRKHHCRLCGMIFCSTCSAYFVKISTQAPESMSLSSKGDCGTMRTCKMCYDHISERGLGVMMRGATEKSDVRCGETSKKSESSTSLESNVACDRGFALDEGEDRSLSRAAFHNTTRDIVLPKGYSASDSKTSIEEVMGQTPSTSSEIKEQLAGFQGSEDSSGDFHALSMTRQRLNEESRKREEQERVERAETPTETNEALTTSAGESQPAGLKTRLGGLAKPAVRQLRLKSSSNLGRRAMDRNHRQSPEMIEANPDAVEVRVGDCDSNANSYSQPESKLFKIPQQKVSLGDNDEGENAIRISESHTGIDEVVSGQQQNKDAVISAKRHIGTVAAKYLEKLVRELLETDAPFLLNEIKETSLGSDLVQSQLTDIWINTLMTLATRCCATVEPDVKNKGDLLDIRPYCKIKVIPGGSVEDSAYMSGVIFRKNVSHKKMARIIPNAKIMLLSGGIEYTRSENRIASLDTLLEQEERYMEILVTKIFKLRPNILIVGKSVSRKAQELLLRANIVLIQHVKPTLITRIARQTGATVLSSTDHVMNQFGSTMLGTCRRFRLVAFRDNDIWVDGGDESNNEVILTDPIGQISSNDPKPKEALPEKKSVASLLSCKLQNHERQAALAARKLGEDVRDGTDAVKSGLAKRGVAKTYVMIEGCPKELGCTVVLRGASRPALKLVKRVLRFMINAAYNMKLETSYILERCGRLPETYEIPSTPCCSSSLCVNFGQPPNNRKARPWNGGRNDPAQRSISGKITPLDHQAILITSVWMTDKTQCCPAEVKGICYYSMQDVSLGQFLRDSCFNLSLKCQNPSCKKSVIDHSLSFIHNNGLINITVERLDNPIPTSNFKSEQNEPEPSLNTKTDDEKELDGPIATWTYCPHCKIVVTPLVFISKQSWQWSFGKFLEVYFYNRDAIMNAPGHCCSCQMQRSVLYFGCGNLAARFTYEDIAPYSVFCRRHLPFDEAFHRSHSLQELNHISTTSSTLFVKFDRQIEAITRETRELFGSALNKPDHLQNVLSELNLIGAEVHNASQVLQEKISTVVSKYSKGDNGKRGDAKCEYNEALFNFPWFARRYLFMLSSAWNERLSAAGQAVSAMKKIHHSSGSGRTDSAVVPVIVGDANAEDVIDGMKKIRQLQESYARTYNVRSMTLLRNLKEDAGLFEDNLLPDGRIATIENEAEMDDEEFYSDPENDIDFEEDVDADVLASRNRIYSPTSSSTPSVRPTRQRPKKSLGTPRRDLDLSGDINPLSATMLDQNPLAFTGHYDGRGDHHGKNKTVTAGGAVKSALNRFFNRGGNKEDPYVVDLGLFTKGRPRLQTGIGGLVIPVFDDQPSTIIAHSLASSDYDLQFNQFLSNSTPNDNKNDKSDPSRKDIERRMLGRNKSHIKHTFRDFDTKGQQLCKFVCTTFWSVQFNAVRQAFMNPQISNGHKDSTNNDIIISGLPISPSSNLDIEKSYIRSLATSFAWAASGGKSGASFSRTSDDRFVIKCISRTELQMFLDCAPAYFEYLSKAFFHGLPTVLCKIVGVYQIGYHNRLTGKRTMEQVAVMQNIFFGRKISKIFDLKGSLRGRFTRQLEKERNSNAKSTRAKSPHDRSVSVSSSESDSDSSDDGCEDDSSSSLVSRDNKVQLDTRSQKAPPVCDDDEKISSVPTLLDGDFLEFTAGRPLPLTDRAKAVFSMSILNDTLFLSIINVLDYSILVGIDEEKMELVVGIIDFMRQYDILKQMERVGKSLPMVVGSEAPTIIQPPLYKARFTNAMERYFMTVPSKWTTI